MLWAEIDGRPECVGVTIAGDGRALPVTVLRQVPLGDFIASDRAEMSPPTEATGGMRESAAERLRLAAEVYRQALADGRKPTKAVAEHFEISSGGASNLVARVRSAGLLPPTSPGKAAGARAMAVEEFGVRVEAIKRWAELGLLTKPQAEGLMAGLVGEVERGKRARG